MMKTDYLETKFAGTVGSALKLEYNSLLHNGFYGFSSDFELISSSFHHCFRSGFKYHIPFATFHLKKKKTLFLARGLQLKL